MDLELSKVAQEGLPENQQQAERQTIPLTFEMVQAKQVKPGDIVTPSQDLNTSDGARAYSMGKYYKVLDYYPIDQQTGNNLAGGLLTESDSPTKGAISFDKGGWAPYFQKVVYTPEEQQYQFLSNTFGELPGRILGILAQYDRGLPYETLQRQLLDQVYRGKDTTEVTPEIVKAFQNLRQLQYLEVSKNRRVMITPRGKQFLAFR